MLKKIIKKFLIFFKLFNLFGRLYFLINAKGLILGLYNFFILDLLRFFSHKIFDYYWNIKTTKIVEVKDLDIMESQQKHSVRYQATSIKSISSYFYQTLKNCIRLFNVQ